MIDLEYFCWREPCKDADGDDRLLIPRSDPFRYEHPVDMIWASEQEAIEWREQEIVDLTDPDPDAENDDKLADDDEAADVRSWVLVKYVGRVIVPARNEIDVLLNELEEGIDKLDGPVSSLNAQKAIQLHMQLRKIADAPGLFPDQQTRVEAITTRVLREAFGMEPQ
jgi:hypothetical protein